MHTTLEQRANALEAAINTHGDALIEAHKLLDISPIGIPAQGRVTAIGRVCCDSEGKLNDKSVLLEGSRATSDGARTRLDLSGPSSYTVFPGQVVAVEGMDATGRKMMAKKVFSGAPLPMPSTDISRMNDFVGSLEDSSLIIWAATGA